MTITTLKDYTDGDLQDDGTSKSSVLNGTQYTDNLAFDSQFEGVPAQSIIYGGTQIQKTDYRDTTAGIWQGMDTDGKAKMYLGDAVNYMKWDGTNLTISGTITAGAIDIGGADATSFHVDSNGNMWLGNATFIGAPFTVSSAGALTATSATVTGAITAGVGSSLPTTYFSGTIAQANLNIADRGWTQTSIFSVTDADTVAWAIGVFTSADGTVYNITASDTGNMVAKTYIYLDIAVSTTAYQTTTTSTTAVGVGKVLVAIAQNGTTEATFQVMQGQGGQNIDASNIVAGSITANEIAATTITSGKMNVTQLSAIAADMGAISAGSLDIGGDDTTSAHIDSTGNFWSGESVANKATAPVRINNTGVAYFTDVYIGGSTYQYKMNNTGVYTFGDGSDGTVAFNGSNTYSDFATKSGDNYTLTRDVFAVSITISDAVFIYPAGYRIYCQGTLTMNAGASIYNKGGDAPADYTGGAGGTEGYLAGGQDGGNGGGGGTGAPGAGQGGAGNTPTAPANLANSIGLLSDALSGKKGGGGGAAGAFAGGDGAFGIGSSTNSLRNIKPALHWHFMMMLDINTDLTFHKYTSSNASGGGGGGGGGASGSGDGGGDGGNGGGGGGTGGIVYISARSLIMNATARISVKGGAGGSGGPGLDAHGTGGVQRGGGGGGGGGTGGNGGVIFLIYNTISNSADLEISGGAGGTKGVGGNGMGGGANGADGVADGSSGTDGKLIEINMAL